MTRPAGRGLRVLVLHNSYREPGGEDSVVRTEGAMLRAAGHDVRLHQVTNPEGARALPALAASAWNTRAARTVRHLVEDWSPDVVHVHNTWFGLSAAVLPAATRTGAACVVTLHNYRAVCVRADLYREGTRCTLCVGRTPVPGVLGGCYRGSAALSAAAAVSLVAHARARSAGAVDLVLTPSRTARDLLLAGGVPEGLLRVKPNPVPDPGRRPAPPSASNKLVYLGRPDDGKGLPELLGAWRRCPPPGLELLLVGVGNGCPEAVDVPGVRTAGWTSPDDVRRLLLSARAVLCPSRMFETFGLVAAEGMAAGTPVATSAGGAPAEVVGTAGPPPVPPGDAGGWSRALEALRDDDDVDAWGRLGRRRYELQLSPAVALAGLEDAYREARSRRDCRATAPT